MRRILAIFALVACLAPLAAHADPLYLAGGLINGANPATLHGPGITETLSPCGTNVDPQIPQGQLQGVDGFWLPLPASARGHAATLTPEPFNVTTQTISGQMIAYFYDADCNLIKPPGTDGSGPKDAAAYSMSTSNPVPTLDPGKIKTSGQTDVYPAVHGTVPTMASFVIINMYVGAKSKFSFEVAR